MFYLHLTDQFHLQIWSFPPVCVSLTFEENPPYTITPNHCTIPPLVPTNRSSGPSAIRVNTASQCLNCALNTSARVRYGVLMAALGLKAQGLIGVAPYLRQGGC